MIELGAGQKAKPPEIWNLIQALSRTYVCFQVLSRPWIHMSEIQVLSSTFKKRGNPGGVKCFELVHFQPLPEVVENAFDRIAFVV